MRQSQAWQARAGRGFVAPAMSFGFLLLGALETLRVSIPSYTEGLLHTARRERTNARIFAWSRRLVEEARIEIETEGLEHAAGAEPFVVMSNHQSLYDIPVVFQAVPRPMRMIAKKELFSIPVFGRAMRAAEIIELDRQNRRRAIAAMEQAKAMVKSGLSIWIAPEGTRSRTGELGAFKRGGFHLALGTGARILPVTVSGTRDVLPAGTLRLRRGVRVCVRLSEPVTPADYGKSRLDELVGEVRARIDAQL
jgi:1-acyl-sn-glycerol-3-phosphate acyltransferase